MNVFSKLKKLVVSALGFASKSQNAAPGVTEKRNGKLRFNQPKRFRVKLHPNNGKSFRGPVFLPPKEDHHVSRQTCRARLRALFFGQFSVQYQDASRRQRRRLARLAAGLEYRRMMNDITNRIPDDDPALAHA